MSGSRNPNEDSLLATLRQAPGDEATRTVYADLLEEQGEPDKAAFVRDGAHDHLARPGDRIWRQVTARAPVDRCLKMAFDCPKKWDELAPKAVGERFCSDCKQSVFYCSSIEEAEHRGRLRQCIAIDVAVPHDAALRSYDGAAQPVMTMKMGMIAPVDDANPPAPPPPLPPPTGNYTAMPLTKPSLWQRLGSWLRK